MLLDMLAGRLADNVSTWLRVQALTVCWGYEPANNVFQHHHANV